MDKQGKFPGYTAILPPRVRYDDQLPPAAKLIYAEITAMTDVTGFCWATNGYLGRLIRVSKDRAARLVGLLESRGYVRTEVVRDEKNAVQERRIYVTDLGLVRLPPPGKNNGTPPGKNNGRGIGKNNGTPPVKNTGTTMNDKNNNVPPYSPPKGGRARRDDHKSAPDWAPEDFEKLWAWYPGDPERHSKRGNRQRAIRAWDKLHPSPELIEVIAEALARQAGSEDWGEGVGIPHLSTYLNGYGWEGWTDSDQ